MYQKRPIYWKTTVMLLSCTEILLLLVQTGVVAFPLADYKHKHIWLMQKQRVHQVGRVAPPFCRTNPRATASAGDTSEEPNNYLERLLHRHGYGHRILTLSSDKLPVLAEMYDHGQWELCWISGFQLASKTWTPPLVDVQVVSKNELDRRTVDIGQITTIWDSPPKGPLGSWRKEVEREINMFPVQHRDRAMQRLYQSRSGPSKTAPPSGLSKKNINMLVVKSPDEESRPHTESVLRKVVKAGAGMSRLADSSLAMDYLYDDYPEDTKDIIRRQIVGAHVLAQDAEMGGRFKRMGCIFISAQQRDSSNNDLYSVTLTNGGWLAVDQSVRAGTEARKFVQRTERTSGDDSEDVSTSNNAKLKTVADERIAQRLECLAMGGIFSWGNDGRDQQQEEGKLEVDVREALKAMGLPATPEGAQEALLRIGRWSQRPDHVRLEPWSQSSLDAARWFAEIDQERRRNLYENSLSACGIEAEGSTLEKRVDLTTLPCICVDARRTSFRDDAIGVRPRSSTGRKVTEASKYEILIHIADVSDIYAPETLVTENPEYFRVLRSAAESRGMSRYDLPLGPLHLMPPVALEALSLKTTNVDMTSKATQMHDIEAGANRCVTLWAYIDEKTGKVIDAGLERTLVSIPIALSFADASDLLVGKVVDPSILSKGDHILRKAKAILSVVERNILLWNAQHRQSNEAARKREKRLSVKELTAKELKDTKWRDDGRDGFQRTRGHKLVDASLNLYGYGVSSLLRRAKAPIPRASGSGASRGGRVATAPLRRYIDGVSQRQVLSVLCGYGGPPMTRAECVRANKIADAANNALSNIRAMKQVRGANSKNTNRGGQQEALRLLQADLADNDRPVPAMGTGRENEVVILGVGSVAKCRGVKGSLKPGAQILVKVRKLDVEKGILSVSLVQNGT